MSNHLLCLGFGYSASTLAQKLDAPQWRISGTTRSDDKADNLEECGFDSIIWSGDSALPSDALEGVTHLVQSVKPDENGDLAMQHCADQLAAIDSLQWIGVLSTTGVYGDADGGWVDERTPTNPTNKRSENRVVAEQQWVQWGTQYNKAVQIFRLPGIYGPHRNALTKVKEGKARRIKMENQYFSRIHVADIANALIASIHKPQAGEIYNVADDLPSSAADVTEFAANLLGIDPPPLQTPDDAQLSEMARSFYSNSKRVRNDKIKRELDFQLEFPDYKAGLQRILKTQAF